MKLLKSVGGYVVISCIESTMYAKTVIVSEGDSGVSELRVTALCL